MKRRLHSLLPKLVTGLVLLSTLLAVAGCGNGSAGAGDDGSTAPVIPASGKDGSMATYTAPSSYLTATITVRVTDGKGGVAIGTGEIEVVCCGSAKRNLEWEVEIATPPVTATTPSTGANQLPVIDSITSEWRLVERGKTSLFKVFAHDPDGDKLSYEWSVDRGVIKPVK